MVVLVVVVGLYLCVLAPDMHLSYTCAHTHALLRLPLAEEVFWVQLSSTVTHV